ncbi:hypothetical protein [Burkholderia sp. A1]|uniref:hypothetical protein n=1 Tax=Burkholderia sp. A1 TaxID=148446 RepID=UPI001268E3CF|nr:hypothetical protein [Burkholderia sp. A1]
MTDVLTVSPYAGEFGSEMFPGTLREALAFIEEVFVGELTADVNIMLSRPIMLGDAEIFSSEFIEIAS